MAMTIAIGSTNPAKVTAVRQAVLAVWPEAQLCPVAVDSGVGAMPMSDEEGVRGALQRARAAREITQADLGIGLEGAAQDLPRGMVLTNWVAIVAQDGRTSVTSGGRLPLPEVIARELRAGGELGPIIDRYTGRANTKQHEGAAGFLTSGLIPRDQAFQIAVAFALAPFLHPELYNP
jgi:inosine/xanthosine triphosphatase